jgi:hypothetical protein
LFFPSSLLLYRLAALLFAKSPGLFLPPLLLFSASSFLFRFLLCSPLSFFLLLPLGVFLPLALLLGQAGDVWTGARNLPNAAE